MKNRDLLHIICPRCGCEMESGDGKDAVADNIAPGVYALKAKENGLDFSKFVAMTTPQQRYEEMLNPEHKPVVEVGVPMFGDDVAAIRESIKEDGYVKNTKGHRRFITAQMFRMLNHKGGYTAALNNLPYGYQWDMLMGGKYDGASELKTIAHLEKADKEAFEERTMFFNKDVIIAMLDDYKRELICRSFTYDALRVDIVKDALNKAHDYADIYLIMLEWYKSYYRKLPTHTAKSKVWVDAYKGSGAYYTLMNLVKYHDCFVPADYSKPATMIRGEFAVKFLKDVARRSRGWELLGLLKETIKLNDFMPNWR